MTKGMGEVELRDKGKIVDATYYDEYGNKLLIYAGILFY